jgi:hypothetical protein
MFNFSDLVLEQLTLEVRYENGYLYLDNCGKVWRKILNKWPSAKVDGVSVNEAKLQIPDKHLTMVFSPDRVALTQNYPAGISEIGEFSDFAVSTVREFLEISAFTRVGNRFIYMLKVEDEKESLALMHNTGFFNIPNDKVSLIGDTVKNPNVRFQISRNGEVGYGISLGHVGRTLNIQLPKPIKYDAGKFILSGLAIDVDFFTMKPIESGNVKAHELIKKNSKDMESLIPGLFK